jgi:hypothetical protein
MKRISTILILLSLLAVPTHVAIGESVSPWVRDAVALVNEERAKHGLPALSISDELSLSASKKLTDMETSKYFAHTSPAGKTPWRFFDAVGYDYRYAGENLAIHFKTPEAEHTAWMESEKHCQNILDPRFREIGMSVRKVFMEGRETVLVVQHFGTRAGEVTVASSGKEAALAMCRGEVVPIVSGATEDGEGRIALLSVQISNDMKETIDKIRMFEGRYGSSGLLAIVLFSAMQIVLVAVSLRILLAHEYREGIYPS